MRLYQDTELTEDSCMPLREWLEHWMEDYTLHILRSNTLRSYEQYIRCCLKPCLENKVASRITRVNI